MAGGPGDASAPEDALADDGGVVGVAGVEVATSGTDGGADGGAVGPGGTHAVARVARPNTAAMARRRAMHPTITPAGAPGRRRVG